VFLVLEGLDHAHARGATVLGEIAGWAVNTDGYMPYYTIEPHGQTLARAIQAALARASVVAADVGVVFADGSAVPREDSAEVLAMSAAFGDNGPPVTAVKPATGHLMGAASVADVALALRALHEHEIPPIANLDAAAPGFDLDFVTGTARSAPALEHAVVVSRGLGGVNACLVLTR